MTVTTLTRLEPYSDDRGNTIEVSGEFRGKFSITFRGSNNRLVIAEGAKLGRLTGSFDGDDALMTVGSHTGLAGGKPVAPGLWHFRIGERSEIHVGNHVSTTNMCYLSALEGTKISLGDDCMIASDVEIRADDAHAIYDVVTGDRVNQSRDISIGRHVWLGIDTLVLAGVGIGRGSVVGAKSVVTNNLPNNVVAVGNPARVVRENIAWERPHLSLAEPHFRPDASVIDRTEYAWELTDKKHDPHRHAYEECSMLK